MISPTRKGRIHTHGHGPLIPGVDIVDLHAGDGHHARVGVGAGVRFASLLKIAMYQELYTHCQNLSKNCTNTVSKSQCLYIDTKSIKQSNKVCV